MPKVYEFLANGFEEIEALTTVDVLRRGGVEVVTVSISDDKVVTGAHGVDVVADRIWKETDGTDADMLLLPGGMPGAANLDRHEGLCQLLTAHAAQGKMLGAVCAAPMVLGHLGLLQGRRATCYPGFENHLAGARYTGDLVTIDDNIITGEGPAATLPYAYAILSALRDEATAHEVAGQMMYLHLMERK